MNKRYKSEVALLLLGSHVAYATNLEPVTVTATRTAKTADDTLASVSIITRNDIERKQIQSVQEALRDIPGISISSKGGLGKDTTVHVRGTEADHVLVLIDGVKVGSVTKGSVAFQYLPIEHVERIEIVRGPRSSLYGSEAIGGVIHIITRKGKGKRSPSFSSGAGSERTYSTSARISGGIKRGWFSLNASAINTSGFNACNGKPSPGGAGCFTIEPDDDGYRNISASLRAGYRLGNGLEVGVNALRAEGATEFDGNSVNESESLQQVLGGKAIFSPLDTWLVSLAIGRSQDESDNFKDGLFKSRFNTERDSLSFQNDISFGDSHLLTLGFDYQDDQVSGTTDYALSSRDNKGLFTQYQGTFASHDLQFSLRQDDNEQFGKQVTGGIAWGYSFGKKMRMTVSYGTAFKSPTFNELYFPDFGNASLLPEDSRSFELGLNGKASWGHWAVNTYETRINDLIAYDSSIRAPGNISEVRILGIELVMGMKLSGWDLNTNLTLLDHENRSSGSNNGNVLPRRAVQSFKVDADRQIGKYAFGATLLAQGKRYDNLSNSRKIDGYALVDLRSEYRAGKNWRIQGRIENLFDEVYETSSFFNQPGRSLFITLRYSPN